MTFHHRPLPRSQIIPIQPIGSIFAERHLSRPLRQIDTRKRTHIETLARLVIPQHTVRPICQPIRLRRSRRPIPKLKRRLRRQRKHLTIITDRFPHLSRRHRLPDIWINRINRPSLILHLRRNTPRTAHTSPTQHIQRSIHHRQPARKRCHRRHPRQHQRRRIDSRTPTTANQDGYKNQKYPSLEQSPKPPTSESLPIPSWSQTCPI